MCCLGVSGGISVKTGFEKERTLGGDGNIDTIVFWQRVRILILGGMSSTGSFFKVRGFFSREPKEIGRQLKLEFHTWHGIRLDIYFFVKFGYSYLFISHS